MNYGPSGKFEYYDDAIAASLGWSEHRAISTGSIGLAKE
jgi:hypothetical protein